MARALALAAVAGVAAAVPAELIQTEGVSAGVASQIKLVQKIISQLQREHRKAAHDADVKLLADGIATIKACDDDLKETSAIDTTKGAMDGARSALVQCRAKEAELLAFSQGEKAKLDNFVSASSQGPTGGLGCDMPAPTQLDDAPDGMGDFFKASLTYYTNTESKLNTLVENDRKARAAWKAKKAECDDQKQPAFEAAYCAWTVEVTSKRTNYAACRKSTEKDFDDTFDDVTVKSGHRKSDFVAVNRVRCLLKVLMLEGSADSVDAELNKCLDATYDTSGFNIAKADYPPEATETLAALGDIPGETKPLDSVSCK